MKAVKELFSQLANYITRSASEARRWFRAGSTFWVWLVLTVGILFAFYVISGQLSDRVRWAGTLFEFLGISAVVIGIDRTRRSFGKPSVLQGMGIWLGEFRFIFVRRPPIKLSAHRSIGISSVAAAAMVVNKAGQSLEERVAQLERQTTELQTRLGNIDQKVEQQKRELRAEIDKEAAARRAADEGVSKKLEEGMVGDSSLELAGVFYLYLGLVMVHLSTEVATGLERLGLH
jgi:hypothetical protein